MMAKEVFLSASVEFIRIGATHGDLKVHKHEIYFSTFFAETETFWSQGPVTWDFWKSYSIRPRYSTFKHFRVCSASDEMRSAYASSYADIRENWLLVGWACVELVTRWLSMRGNWLLFGWAYAEIRFYWYWTLFFPLSSVPLSPFPVPCLTSYVSCLKCLFLFSHPLFPVSRLISLFPVHCSLSHISVPFLPSAVPCLTSLFLVFRSLSPILCSMFHFFVPCLPSSVPCLTFLFLVSRPLFHVSLFCSLSPGIPSSFLGNL